MDSKPSFVTHHAKGTYHIKQAHSCVQAKVVELALVSNETLFDDCHVKTRVVTRRARV